MSNNTRLAELMNYITIDTTSGNQLQMSGSIKQTAVTSAILKTSATGVISAATAGTDYLTSVGISNLTATGTPSATTYLRGDNTWATVSGGGSGVTLDTTQTITGAKTFQAATNFTNISTMDTLVNWGANQLTSSGWGTLPANWSGSFDTAYTITAGGGTLTNTLSLPIYSYFRATITATVTTTGTFDIYCGGGSGDAYWSSVSMPVGTFTSSKFAFTTTTGTTSLVASSTLVATISNIKIELLSGSNLPNTTYNSSSGNNKIELTVDNISSSNNINVGLDAGKKNYSGINNVAIGSSTLMENLTGSTNIAIGFYSLKLNKIGYSNVGVGAYALQSNINANLNVGVGVQALSSVTTGSWNTAVGSYALSAITSSTENVAVGESAFRNMTSGSKNVAVGDYAGGYHITGNNNVFLGASINYTTNPTNSNDSIIIGTQSKSLASGQSNQIVIGFNTTGLGSNTTVLGNSSTVTTAIYGNLLLGTTATTGANLTTASSVTASSAIARGVYFNNTLVASANNDVLVGLDINPTFTNGAFTGVTNYGLRVNSGQAFINDRILIANIYGFYGGLVINSNRGIGQNSAITIHSPSSSVNNNIYEGTRPATPTTNAIIHYVGTDNQIYWDTTNGSYNYLISNSQRLKLFTTGNLLLQNGGTFTDNGYRLEVNGTTRFIGTTASDTAPLGSELAAVTGTGTNWTLAGTNLNVGGYTHTTGSTTPLTTTLAAVSGTYYQITYTITGRTAGSIDIAYGGTITFGLTVSGNTGPLASSTSALTITPTTDFNGTVVLSIKSIGNSSASSTLASSGGSASIEFRASSSTNNTFIGLSAGYRNTTGTSNTFIGAIVGGNNTTGSGNTFIGNNVGNNNTTAGQNIGIGANVLSSISTGSRNIAIGGDPVMSNLSIGNDNISIGRASLPFITSSSANIALGSNAGRFIANGSTSLTACDNSIFIGIGSKALADSQSNQIVIGYQSVGLGSNTTVLGNSSTTLTALYGSVITGGTSISTSAQLQVDSTTKGVLFPRMTTTQKNAISTPPAGLVVYDTDLAKLCIRTASAWETITSA